MLNDKRDVGEESLKDKARMTCKVLLDKDCMLARCQSGGSENIVCRR